MTLEEDLKQFYYHWFWGLRHNSTPEPLSLWTQVNQWPENEMTLARQKQAEIKHKIWPVRLFYWLFNLSDYAKNYYQLAAHDLMFEHRNKRSTMSFFDKLKSNARNKLGNFLNNPQANEQKAPTEEHQNRSTPKKKEELPRPPEVIDEEMQVATWMLPHFKAFGMDVVSGQLIKFNEIKKTYLQKALALHPDKNPSPTAHQDFITLSTGYKKIEKAFNGSSEEVINSFSNADLWEMCSETRSRIDKVIQSYDEIANSYDEIANSYDEIAKSYDEIVKDAREIRRDIRAIRDEVERDFKKIFEANQLQIERNNRRLDELKKIMAEEAVQVSNELTEKDKNELTFHVAQVFTTPEVTFTARYLSEAQNIEPLTSLVRSGFFNPLTIRGLIESYFSQLRKTSFPFFTSSEPVKIKQIFSNDSTFHTRREPVLMICDKPSVSDERSLASRANINNS